MGYGAIIGKIKILGQWPIVVCAANVLAVVHPCAVIAIIDGRPLHSNPLRELGLWPDWIWRQRYQMNQTAALPRNNPP